jgi:hypothetical protein
VSPSDTLVIGPVAPFRRPLRVRLATLVASGGGLLVLVGLAALGLTSLSPTAAVMPGLPWLPTPTPTKTVLANGTPVVLVTRPAGAVVLADGLALATTPAAVAMPSAGRVVLRHDGYLDSVLLGANDRLDVPLWRAPTSQAVRSPLPGGQIVGVDVLADGGVVLDVTVPTAPTERQAWVFDPATAGARRIGPSVLAGAAPAGVAMAPDGAHAVSLLRGATSPADLVPLPDTLLVDGPDGHHAFVPDGVLARGERVLDLTWAPTGRKALLLSQRPVTGGSRFRLRRVDADGSAHDLVDLPVEPVEASWAWSPGGEGVAFLVRTAAPTLATLDLTTGALRSVTELPNDVVPGLGALAPAAWRADGSLLFAAPIAQDASGGTPTPMPPSLLGSAGGQPKRDVASGLYELPANQASGQRLGASCGLLAAPAVLADGTVVQLARDGSDGTLLLRTLDGQGNALTEQRLGLEVPPQLGVRWDLAHGRAIVLVPAERGGIDVRVLSFGQEAPR